MTPQSTKIQRDFDRIARLSHEDWDHNSAYHAFLIRQLPPANDTDALEIGCGTGAFSRLLARRYRRVLAVDLSPGMIVMARERSRTCANIDYRAADAMAEDFPEGRFGCAASIATLHHLPLGEALRKLKDTLMPGGTLLVLDLYKPGSLADYAVSLLAIPVNLVVRLAKTGRLRESAAVRTAWREHGRGEVYPTLTQVRQTCERLLPGARITRHLLWRYSIVWKAGADG